MRPVEAFRQQPPEFWAMVKLVSQLLGYGADRLTGPKNSRAGVDLSVDHGTPDGTGGTGARGS